MKLSIIVCTKDRPTELARCIRSIIHQSRLPDEVVIVHGGIQGAVGATPSGELRSPICFKHIYSPPPNYLTSDRNKGVRSSIGDIIVFVDDDTVLHRDFIREITKVFENDSHMTIGGVMGRIENRASLTLGAVLRLLIRHVFMMPREGDGSFLPSGSPTFVHQHTRPREVEFLSGSCMAYRRQVFQEFKFDEGFLEAHMYIDDEDFSYRVSRRYRNVYTPYARLTHNPSPIGRDRKYVRAKMMVIGRHYLVKKNFQHTTRHMVSFWWSVVGLITEAIVFRDVDTLKGLLDGVRTLLASHSSNTI